MLLLESWFERTLAAVSLLKADQAVWSGGDGFGEYLEWCINQPDNPRLPRTKKFIKKNDDELFKLDTNSQQRRLTRFPKADQKVHVTTFWNKIFA